MTTRLAPPVTTRPRSSSTPDFHGSTNSLNNMNNSSSGGGSKLEGGDLSTLSELNETILLRELHARYSKGDIYTYIGDILIAINPYKDLNLYTDSIVNLYKFGKRRANPPHIFAVADSCYQNMLRTHDNQCIVISGESGAGKTECTKLIVRHLINLARGQQTNKLEDRILEVNPLLEAFGNAQTVMNSNSSRFGKYIELNFDLNGSVIGANISHYLLEKSRIVSHAFAERNFHVFYYLFAGLSSSARSKYKLGAVSDYRYLRACAAPSLSYQQASYVGGPLGTGSNFMTAPEDPIELRKKDAAKFSALTDIMDAIGFKPQQKEDLCTILAVVLHIGNIEFKANEQDNAVISGEKEIRAIAELFSIHIKDISEAITARVTITGGERIRRHVSVEQACEARDAMAKILYQFLFSWIVRLVNKLFAAASVAAMAAAAAAEGGESSSSSSSSSSGKALRPLSTVNGDIKQTSISILDIFGFENFQRNSFEQLCINTANETLQHYFNQHIFKWEQEEYIREGIQYNHVTFVDNQPCVALLMGKPMGILSILDEESHFPKATDETFVGKLMHHFQRSPYVEKHPLQQGSAFVISHYASKVSYSAVLFLEKNRDSVPEGIIDLLRSATDVGLLQEILDTEPSLQAQPEPGSDLELPIQSLDKKKSVSNPTKKRGSLKKLMRKPSVKNVIGSVSKPLDKKRVKATVATSFRNSLADLMNKMFACNPHFVRCIKPNAGKVHGAFDPEYCLVQLRYSGVLETIRVRRQGFALRMPFEDFISRYKVAAVNLSDSLSADGEGCTKILSKVVGPEGWEIGVTRVFVKAPQVEILDQVVDDYYKKVVFVQKATRGLLARIQFAKLAQKRREEEERLKEQQKLLEEQQRQEELRLQEQKRLQELESEMLAKRLQAEEEEKRRLEDEHRRLTAESLRRAEDERQTLLELERANAHLREVEQVHDQSVVTLEVPTLNGNYNNKGDNNNKPLPPITMESPRSKRSQSVTEYDVAKESPTLSEEEIFKQMVSQQQWYHGCLTRSQAEAILTGKGFGTFLVRVGDNRLGYCISLRRVEGVSHYPILFAYSKYFIVGHEDDKFDTLAEMVEHYKYLPLSSENDLLLFPEYCRENYGFGDFINMDQVERVRRSAQVRGDRLYAQQLARDETAKAKKKHLERQQQTRSVGPNIGSSRPQPGRTPSTPNIVISDTPNSNLSASTTASTSPSLSHHGSRISVSYNLQGEELNVFLEEVEKINNLIKIETRIFEGAQRLVLSGTQSKKSQKERVKTLMESENHLNALKARLKELESMTSQQRIEWSKAATLQRANFNKVFPTVDDVSPNTSRRNSAIVGGSPGSISPNTSSNNLPAAGGGGGGGQSLNQNLSSPRGRLESLDTSNQVQQLQYGAAQVVGHSALQSPSSSASFASVSSSASFTSTTSSNSIGATNSTTTTTTTSGVEEGKKKKKWAKNNMMAGRGLDNYAPAYVK